MQKIALDGRYFRNSYLLPICVHIEILVLFMESVNGFVNPLCMWNGAGNCIVTIGITNNHNRMYRKILENFCDCWYTLYGTSGFYSSKFLSSSIRDKILFYSFVYTKQILAAEKVYFQIYTEMSVLTAPEVLLTNFNMIL